MASERAWTGRTPAATAGRSVASGRDRWCESARSVRGGVKTKVVTSDGGRARRAVRIVGAASARDEDEDEDDERRDERFRESIAFGGGRREVAFSFDVDDVNEEDDDVVDAGRRPGAGKVGMAGFDGYPGFASFAWMTEAAYEEYEDSHDHDDDDDDEMEEAIAESVVVSQAKTTDETTVTTTVTTTSTETSKTTSSTIGATRVGELARGLVSDTETKVIYAGVATAAALLGAKSFGGGKVCPPPATGAQTSTVGEKRPRDENVDKMAKPTEDTQIKDSRTGKVMSLPSGVTKVAAVAGVLSAASTVAIASGASLPRFGGGGGSTKSKAKGSGGSIIRLERLRQSMILEFEDEMAKLGRMEVEKNNELKTLNDNFKRSLTGVKLGSLRDEALSGAADGDEQNQQLQKVIAEMERHHQDEIKAKEAAFAAQAETLKASIAKLQNALNVAESALREAEEVNKSMMSQHEVELRAARGLIRAERELGRSEANKYRAARDLERVHVVNLRSALALAKVTSGERLTFLEDQLKAICSSYSARIIRERAEFAAKLEEARSATNADAKPSPRQIEDTSTARDEFASKIAEVRAEADAEISNLLAKHASAMRSASGERRALKVLYESEMRKGAAEKTRSEDPIIAQLRGEIAAREVAISAQQNDAIRDAQIDFEKRVVALKNAHKAEIEQLRVSASRDGSSDRIRALEEAHQMSIKATAEAHARALEDAEAEASKRVAEAEDRARDAIAKLDAGEAAKAQILAQFDAERTDIANQLQSEQLKGTEDIESMRAQYEEMLVRAVAQVQGVANDEKEKLEASIRELQERVAADKTELDRLQEQVAGKGADLSAEIGQLQKQLDERAEIERDLRGQIAAAKQTMLSSGAESDSEREALRAQVTRLEAQLADMKKSKEQYDATIESLKQSASSGAADRNATSQTDAQIGALKQQLEEQSRLLEDQKLYAEEQLVEAVAELKSENEMLTAKLRASSATTTSVSASQLNDAVRDAQIAFEQRVVALKKVHREEIERVQKAAQLEVASNGDRELIDAVAELQSEKAALEAKIRALSASTGSATASPTVSAAQLNDAIRDAQIQFEQRVVALKKAHREELERVEGMLARAKQDTSESPADNGELERLRSQLAAEVEKFDHVSEDLQRIMADDLAAKQSLRDANATIERLQSELTQAKQSSAPSSSGSSERRDDGEVERLRSQLAAEVDKFNHVSEDLERIMADDIEAKNALRNANLEIERLRDEVSRPTSVVNDEELVKAVAELQAELAAEVEKFNHISADLERIMVDDMAAKSALREANGTIERLQLELSEAKQTSSSSGTSASSSEVQRLQNELKAEIQKFDELSAELQRIKAGDLVAKDRLRQANSEIERLRADLNQPKQAASLNAQLNDAMRDAQIAFEQRVVALKKAHREELERVQKAAQGATASNGDRELIEAVAELQSEKAALEAKIRANVGANVSASQLNDAVREAQIAFEQRVVALKKAHREELERVEGMLARAKQDTSESPADNGELERLRSQLAAEVEKFDHVSEDLQRIMADDLAAKQSLRDANATIERLQSELTQAKQSSAPSSSGSSERRDDGEVERLRSQLAAEVDKFNHVSEDLERIMADDIEAKNALRNANLEIERLRDEVSRPTSVVNDEELVKAVAELQAELAAEVEKFNHISADLERIMVDDMAAKSALREANGTIERLQLELSEAKQTSSSSGTSRSSSEVQRLQNELKAEIQKFDELSAELQRIKAGDLVAKDRLRQANSEIERLRADLNQPKQAASLNAQLNDAMRDAQIAFEQRVVALKKAHREELERVEGMLARAKQDTSESPADNGELERLRSQLAAEVEKFDHVSEDLQRIMADDLAAKQSLRDANATIERLQSELTQAKQSSAPSSSGSSERRDDGEVERLRSQLAAEVDKFNHVSEDLERIMADDIEAKNALRNANLEIERLRDEVSRPTSVMNDEELVKAVAELQAELAAEVEKFNHISADLERIMVDDMAAKSALREANGTIERLQLELSEAKQTSSSSGTSASSSEVQRLQNELKAEIQKFDELSAELQRIKAGDLVAKDRLRQANSEIERLRADLNQPKQAASLNAQLNDAMRDAQIAFEQRVVALKKAHREELERVEGMLARAKQDTSESPADNGELERLRSQLAAEVEKFDHVSEDLQRIMADDLAAKQSLRDANATIERLQSELTQAKQSSAPSSSGSSERRDDGEVERLRSQLAAEVDKFNHVSEDLERIMADDIEAKKALRNANLEIERLRADLNQPKQAASLNAQLNDAMRDAQIAFEQRVVALKKAHREELERVQKAAQGVTASNGDRELIEAVAELQSEKAALESKIRANVGANVSASQLNDAVREAQIAFEQRVVALKKAHREELERVEGMLARAKQDTSESPADNGELERLRSQLAAEVEKFDHVSEDLQRIMADDLAAKQSLRDANATIERLQSELTQAKQSSAPSSSGSSERRDDGEVERLRSQLAAEVDKFNHVSEDLERIMADDIEAKKALRNANLEIERLRADLNQPKQAASLNAQLNDAMRDAQIAFEQRVVALKKAHREELERVQKAAQGVTASNGDRELIEAVAELQSEKAALESKIRANVGASASASQLNDAVRDAQIAFEQRVVALKKAHREELERIKKAAPQASSSGVDREFVEAVAQLRSEKAELEDELRALNATVAANASATTSISASQLNDTLRDAQIAFEQRVVALKKAHQEEIERVQKAAQGVTAPGASSSEDNESELIGAVAELQSEKAELEAKIRALSASTGSATASPTVSAAQLNDAIRDAQIQFEQRVVALKKAHREELERVEGMLARAKQDTSESPADNGELERLRSQLAAEVEKFDHVSEDLQRIMADDLAAKQSLRDANATIERLQSELTQAKQSSAPSSSGSSERRDDGEVERLRSQLAAEVDKFNHVSEDLERIMADDIEAKNALRNANLEIERLRDEVSRPTSVVNDKELVKAVAELQAELAAEVEKFDQISADLERIMADDMDAKCELREANAEIDRLRREMSQAADAASTSDAEDEVERLRMLLASEIEKFDHVSGDLERIIADDLEAKSDLREANTEIERLKTELTTVTSKLLAENDQLKASAEEVTMNFDNSIRELEDLRLTVSKLTSDADLTQVIAELQSELAKRAAIESELRVQVDATKEELDALRSKKSDTVITLPKFVTYTFQGGSADSKQISKLEEKITMLESQLADMQKAKEQYDATIPPLKTTSSDVSPTAVTDSAQVDKLKRQLADQSKLLEAEKERAEKELVETTARMKLLAETDKAKYEAALQSNEKQLIEAVAELQSLAGSEKAELEASLKASRGERRQLYAMMRSELLKNAASSRVDFTAEVASAEARSSIYWEQKLKEAQEKSDAQLASLTQEYEVQIASLKTTKAGSGTSSDVATLQKQLDEVRQHAEQELVRAVAEIQASASADITAIRALVKSESDERFSKAENTFNEEKAALLKAHKAQIEALESSITGSLSQDEQMKLKAAEDEWKKKLQEVENSAKIRAQESAAEHESTVKRLEKQLSEVRDGYESTIKKLNKQLAQSASATEQELQRDLAQARDDLERFMRDQSSKTNTIVKYTLPESITYKFEGGVNEVKRIKSQRDALQKKLDRLEAEYASAGADSVIENRISELKAELESTRAERDRDVELLTNRFKTENAEVERRMQKQLEDARRSAETAEKKYKKDIGESGGWRFGLFGQGKVQDADVDALNDDMRNKASLLKAAEEELAESKNREDELRREAARLTSELEQAISNSSEEIDALKKEFSKNVEAASSNFAVDMKATVDKYETQIAKIKSMAEDEAIAVVAELKTEAQQEMVRAIAELNAEAQYELVQVVARLNEERDASIAAAETKYTLELKRTSEAAAGSASEEVITLTRALVKLEDEKRLLQMDVIAWKDQVKSYEEQLAKSEAARKDLLDKYQHSRSMLTNQLAKASELEQRYHDDMTQAIAQSMAEAAIEFNASLQESEKQTKEVQRQLASLTAELDARVRDAAKKENKRLRDREQELEKQIKRAQRDYANQARKMEKLAAQLETVQSEYKAAEENWSRSMRLMKVDFEQRLKKEQVTLAEKIAFYEQRVKSLTEELTLAKDQAKSASMRVKSESVAPTRPLFEFNRGKLAAEQAAREDAERQLLAAKSEMEALRTLLLAAEDEVEKAQSDLKISEINRSKEVAQARDQGARSVPLLQRLFGTPQKSARTPPTPKVVEKVVVQKSEDSTKVKALEDELAVAARKLSELKTDSRAEFESAKKKIREEYEAELKILQSKVASLEKALSRSDEIAKEKLAMATKAAQAEKDRMEKTLRAEITAAKSLAANAKLSAQRELSSVLRDAEARAKRDLREQAKRAADERAAAEAEIRANAKEANKKLKDKISKFETMLDERDLEIEAKFNAQFDKLVVDFRQEVEILQKSLRAAEKRSSGRSEPKVIEKIVEKVVKADVDGEAYATEIAKTKEDLAVLRKRSEDDMAKLRASYEERLREAIEAKDAALKESREEALKAVSSQKGKAEEQLKAELGEREKALKAEKALKQKLERDRENLERSFEKTVSQRDSYAREVKTLKASLAEAKRRLRDLVDMSDEELRVLEESKKVASELDELKTKYAESMGIAVSEVEDEDVAGLDITKIDTIVARRTKTRSRNKTAVDYFKQLLDMSKK